MDTVAHKINRSKTTVYRIETNKQNIPVDLVPAIGALLNIPPAKLLPDLAKMLEAG